MVHVFLFLFNINRTDLIVKQKLENWIINSKPTLKTRRGCRYVYFIYNFYSISTKENFKIIQNI